ncbi:MAG: BatD family protein [Candidatus Omnitrophica bacterium]|nr:BatD family protein [Candidatus Omnitrophota bacterium]MCF7877444.1 BatD family protein [Candidatus Omnitrophota bacterium]MCF7878053.1 BatD family protein [Candidatus Omnitrophota bacterium]MCF7892734.1 BatD family protein [Candidatus Omnitrophota bacterium]
MSKLPKLFIIILGIFAFLGFFGKSPKDKDDSRSVKVKVSQNKVETGEIFSYLVTIEGEFKDPEVQMPDLDNFRIISRKKTKNFSYQKDKIKAKLITTYFLLCPKPGVFTIKPVRVIDGNKVYKSSSVKISAKGESLEKKRQLQPYIETGTKI